MLEKALRRFANKRSGEAKGKRLADSPALGPPRCSGAGVPPLLSLTELVPLPRVCRFYFFFLGGDGWKSVGDQCLHRVAKRGGLQSVKEGDETPSVLRGL